MPASAGNPRTIYRDVFENPRARLKDRLKALEALAPTASRRLLYNVGHAEGTPSKLKMAIAELMEKLLEARAKKSVAKLKEPAHGG